MSDTQATPTVALTTDRLVAVALVPDCDAPLLIRHNDTGMYILCVNPKRDAVRLLCSLIEAQAKRREEQG